MHSHKLLILGSGPILTDIFSYGRCYRNSNWNRWGRWVALVLIVIFFVFVFFVLS